MKGEVEAELLKCQIIHYWVNASNVVGSQACWYWPKTTARILNLLGNGLPRCCKPRY
jgi:hypothetical protein